MNDERTQIDDINFDLLEIIARRFAVILQISEIKKQRGLPPEDALRVRYMLDRLETVWKSYPISKEVSWVQVKPVFIALFDCSAKKIAEVVK